MLYLKTIVYPHRGHTKYINYVNKMISALIFLSAQSTVFSPGFGNMLETLFLNYIDIKNIFLKPTGIILK